MLSQSEINIRAFGIVTVSSLVTIGSIIATVNPAISPLALTALGSLATLSTISSIAGITAWVRTEAYGEASYLENYGDDFMTAAAALIHLIAQTLFSGFLEGLRSGVRDKTYRRINSY